MALYNNHSQESPIASVEFMQVQGGNSAFFHLKPDADVESAKKLITETLGQQVESETKSGKHIVLGTHGDKTREETLSQLKTLGNNLAVPEEKKHKMDLWKLRGLGSMIGQPMQLVSGLLQKGSIDAATVGFAISNMTANVINWIFGAQVEEDKHQLRYIKTEINNRIAPYLPEGSEPLDVHDKRAELHETKEKTAGQKAYDFMKRYSVTGGDIGLRYLGAAMLAFPIKQGIDRKNPNSPLSAAHWKTGMSQLGKMEFKNAYETLKNSDKATRLAGLMYIGGKALSLTSKVEDPYNDTKKHTWVDTMREKVVFPVSSIIEGAAAGIIALDRLNIMNFRDANGVLKKRQISFDKIINHLDKSPAWAKAVGMEKSPQWLSKMKGNKYRDWLGGVGGLFFTAALALRVFAPFGVRSVDMKEVDAHVADSLAMVPKEQLPQALAESTAFLTSHFRDKKNKRTLQFAEVYSDLADDLKKFHNIDVPGTGSTPPVLLAKATTPGDQTEQTKTFAKPEMKKSHLASLRPASSYQDLVSPVAESIALGP